jgi:hypothetical protein
MAERDPLLHRVGDAAARFGRRPPARRRVRIAIQAGLAILVFGFLVVAVVSQWGELQERDVRFAGAWLLPAFCVLIAYYAMMAFGWELVVRFLHGRISPARAQAVWGQSLLARYVPGNVLFVVGRVMLAEREGVPRRVGLASMLYEVGLGFVAAAATGAYFFIDHPDLSDQPLRFAALAVVPVGLAALHPRVFGPASSAVLRRFGREPLPVVMPMRGVVAMLIYYTATWVVIGFGLFFVARSVHGLDVSELPVVVSAEALGFCAAVMTLVFPGGLGIRDGAFAWALKVAFGGSFAVAAAVAIAARVVLTGVEVTYVALVSSIAARGAPAGSVTGSQGDAVDQLEGGQPEHRPAEDAVAGNSGQGESPDHVPGQ